MAKQLSNEEAEEMVLSKSNHRKYPWKKWMDGNWWHIQEEVDFDILKPSFRNMVYRKQSQYGRIITIEMPDGFLIKRAHENGVYYEGE